jgi:hypothetical protein
MAAVSTTIDASWSGVSGLTWTATRGGITLATAAATIDGLDVSGTLDLSAADLGPLTITLADSDGNKAWEDDYQLARDEVAGDLTSNLLIKSDFTADTGTTVANSGSLGAGTVLNPRAADAHFAAMGGAQNGPCFDSGSLSSISYPGSASTLGITYMWWGIKPLGPEEVFRHMDGLPNGLTVAFDDMPLQLFVSSDANSVSAPLQAESGQSYVCAITVSEMGGDGQSALVSIYENGIAVLSDNSMTVNPYTPNAACPIDIQVISVKLDAFRAWQRVLTAEEVLAATNEILGTDTSLTIARSVAGGGSIGGVLFGF